MEKQQLSRRDFLRLGIPAAVDAAVKLSVPTAAVAAASVLVEGCAAGANHYPRTRKRTPLRWFWKKCLHKKPNKLTDQNYRSYIQAVFDHIEIGRSCDCLASLTLPLEKIIRPTERQINHMVGLTMANEIDAFPLQLPKVPQGSLA